MGAPASAQVVRRALATPTNHLLSDFIVLALQKAAVGRAAVAQAPQVALARLAGLVYQSSVQQMISLGADEQ